MPRLLLFCLVLFLCACARQGVPSGGPRDTTPPRIDSTASTPNHITNFQKREISLRFDEWIVLSDVGSQVLVSPPLRTKRVPDISLKGKTVVVKIPEGEDLRPNTTYTINFGTAIKDLHEGNPAKNLRFVFSTGSYIDSLKVEGYVFDAFKLEPVENVSVMMYEELADSVPLKNKPYYLARTDKVGFFSIPNVKAGQFKIMAIDDKDQNLLWNGGDERISFLAQPLTVSDTLRRPPLTLYLYTDQGKLKSRDRISRNYGQVKITYNSPPDSVVVHSEPPGQPLLREIQHDTLLLWYDRPADSTAAWQLIAGHDTIPVKTALTRAAFLKTHRLTWGDEAAPTTTAPTVRRTGRGGSNAPVAAAAKSVGQHLARPAMLPFSHPIVSVDTSRWQLSTDTLHLRDYQVSPDSANPRRLLLRTAWIPEKAYTLLLLPGAVTDLYGSSNADTLSRKFLVTSDKALGDLTLTIKDLKPGMAYVLQLLSGTTTLEEERRFTATAAQQKLLFRQLPAATYTARLIEDHNGNGRWDAGQYATRRQPEPLYLKALPALRANWEVEASMSATAQGNSEKKKDKRERQ